MFSNAYSQYAPVGQILVVMMVVCRLYFPFPSLFYLFFCQIANHCPILNDFSFGMPCAMKIAACSSLKGTLGCALLMGV